MTKQAVATQVEETEFVMIESDSHFEEMLIAARLDRIFEKELAREINSPSKIIPSHIWDY